MQVNPIEKRPADLAEIALNLRLRTAALASRVAVVTTPAPVQVSTEMSSEVSGAVERHLKCI